MQFSNVINLRRLVIGACSCILVTVAATACQGVDSPLQPQANRRTVRLSEDERRHIRENETNVQRQILAGLDNINPDGTFQKSDTVVSDTAK